MLGLNPLINQSYNENDRIFTAGVRFMPSKIAYLESLTMRENNSFLVKHCSNGLVHNTL